MTDIKITLETLYDILRHEKKREDLQKLETTFYIDVVAYLREKKALLQAQTGGDELFASTEKDKLEYELRSIKRILKEIYEKREKKIIDIALNKSRTKSDIIDTSAMLREEKNFYKHLVAHLDNYRTGVLSHLFKAELPFVEDQYNPQIKEQLSSYKWEQKQQEANSQSPTTSASTDTFNKFEGVSAASVPAKEEEEAELSEEAEDTTPEQSSSFQTEEQESEEANDAEGKTKVRFLHPVPRFIWKDMKEYGPYSQGQESIIFPEVADLLVRKGRAEKV